jgi:hypothetical protein
MERTMLLRTMERGRAELRSVLQSLDPETMEERVNGEWTRRDVLAHLEAWERRVVALFDMLRAGTDPAPSGTTDEVNARFFEESRHRDLEDVERSEEAAYRAVVAAVTAASDGDLFDGGRFGWTEGQPFADWILGNTTEHYEEHLDQLAASRVRAGVL